MNPLCCICEYEVSSSNILIPSQCYKKFGMNGHRVCTTCWFNKFAKENRSHRCPGCIKMWDLNEWNPHGKEPLKILPDHPQFIDLT